MAPSRLLSIEDVSDAMLTAWADAGVISIARYEEEMGLRDVQDASRSDVAKVAKAAMTRSGGSGSLAGLDMTGHHH